MSVRDFAAAAEPSESRYLVATSDEAADPQWDAFVEASPGGHLVQTSLWGQVKTSLRWRADRVVIRTDNMIVGGAQVLTHFFAGLGGLGYVKNGPLCPRDAPRVLQLIMENLFALCKRKRIRYLAVQPPNGGESLAAQLPGFGLAPATLEVAIPSTLVLDLHQDETRLLSKMSPSKRRKIRASESSDLSVRQGTQEDLVRFYGLYSSTSRRHGFMPFPAEYINKMYHTLAPAGFLKLFMAEVQSEVVSAAMVAPFGDRVEWRLFGWSGAHEESRPNDGLVWETIKWAKAQGYPLYDLGGIDALSARSMSGAERLPEAVTRSPAMFKIDFGGTVERLPEAFDFVLNPVLRPVFQVLGRQRRAVSIAQRLLARLGG